MSGSFGLSPGPRTSSTEVGSGIPPQHGSGSGSCSSVCSHASVSEEMLLEVGRMVSAEVSGFRYSSLALSVSLLSY